MESIKIASFYCFTRLDSIINKQGTLQSLCQDYSIKGLIILAEEGVNGTIAGEKKNIDLVLDGIRKIINCNQINLKVSPTKKIPFGKIKIKTKKEIVTFGVDSSSLDDNHGEYVEPKDWNALISGENVVAIDTRNDYEHKIGTFKGAVNPKTESFSDFPRWWKENQVKFKGKDIAMFCTGGIRCEKSTRFLLKQGVRKVYHLKGGILNYLENYKGKKSLWKGECFVFDQRVSVGPNVVQGSHLLCFACRYPLNISDLTNAKYEEGVSCQHCYENTSQKRKNSFRERQKQIKLSELKGEKHLKYF